MKKLLLLALSSFSLAANAAPEKPYYAGGGLSFWNYEQSGINKDFNLTALEGVFGYQVHEYVKVEGRVGFGIEGQTKTIDALGGADVKVDLDYYYAVYLRPELSNDVARFYGLLGYAGAELSTETNSGSDDGLSIGAGVGFFMNPATSVNFEWKKLIHASGYTISGPTIGFDIAF